MLSQLIYISTAPSLARSDMDAILAASARNNPARQITGLLLFNGRNFLQLLEGEERAVASLMETIAADPRHSGVKVIHRSEIAERVCPFWAMKRMTIVTSLESRRESLENELPPALDPDVRKMIVNFAVLG